MKLVVVKIIRCNCYISELKGRVVAITRGGDFRITCVAPPFMPLLREGVALEEELKKLLEREHAQILLHLEFLHIQSNVPSSQRA